MGVIRRSCVRFGCFGEEVFGGVGVVRSSWGFYLEFIIDRGFRLDLVVFLWVSGNSSEFRSRFCFFCSIILRWKRFAVLVVF